MHSDTLEEGLCLCWWIIISIALNCTTNFLKSCGIVCFLARYWISYILQEVI